MKRIKEIYSNPIAQVVTLLLLLWVLASIGIYYLEDGDLNKIGNAFWWTIVTITTVGYGDIAAHTTVERIFCFILMIIGVISFSFASGSLASIL